MKNKEFLHETLNLSQRKYIDAFKWLVGDERLTGRSYLLAICFIEKALNNLGKSVEVWDHYQPNGLKGNMMSLIKEILSKYPEIENYCTLARDWFRISKGVKKVNK